MGQGTTTGCVGVTQREVYLDTEETVGTRITIMAETAPIVTPATKIVTSIECPSAAYFPYPGASA